MIGEINQKNIIFLVNNDFEGLESYESHFVIQVLIGLGVTHLHYVFPVLNAVQEFTKIKDYFSMRLQDCVEISTSDPEKIDSFGEKLVFAFPGPTLPTFAEKEMAYSLDHELITISNMAILNEASNLGLSHSASCFSSDYIDDSFEQNNLSSLIDSLHAPSASIPLKFAYKPSILDLNLIEPPINQTEIEDLATELKISLNPRLTVVVSEEIGNLLLRHFKLRISYGFKSSISQTLHFTSNGILIIKGCPLLKDQENYSQSFCPIFLSNRMGIESIIIFEEVSTCDADEIPLGTVVKITDQCGFAYFNPLSGTNLQSWGERLTEMIDVFNNDLE